MNFWINLWTLFFLLSLALFGGLAVIVTIGGFFDIRSLFKSLTDRTPQDAQEREQKDDDPVPANPKRRKKSGKGKSKSRKSKR